VLWYFQKRSSRILLSIRCSTSGALAEAKHDAVLHAHDTSPKVVKSTTGILRGSALVTRKHLQLAGWVRDTCTHINTAYVNAKRAIPPATSCPMLECASSTWLHNSYEQ
jgi:hypothetical protein